MNTCSIQAMLINIYKLPVANVTYNWQTSNAFITYYNIVTTSGSYFELHELHDGMGNSRIGITEIEEHIAIYYPELLI